MGKTKVCCEIVNLRKLKSVEVKHHQFKFQKKFDGLEKLDECQNFIQG
jgi:hypothetical protein